MQTGPIPRFPAAPAPWRLALLGMLLALLIAAFHLASGSSRAELGSHPDEAAHFVTGLMVRDYLVSGFHESPLRYADDYYRHYPKIGLGNWPPLFYLVQAAWMLVFPVGVASVLWLVAALALALALVLAWWLWRDYGWIEAAAGASLLTALPLVQQYTNMVMAEALVSLLIFAAAGFFALLLEGAEWPGAIGFGLCAGLAVMTKGTGLALALVPPLAILLTGRWSLLKRPHLWAAAVIAAAIAGPWTWHFRNLGRAGWAEPHPSMHFTRMAIPYYTIQTGVALGALLALLALAGAVSVFLPRRDTPAIAATSLALVAAVSIFQSITPVALEARYLMPAMPALMVLAMAGLHWLTRGSLRARGITAAAVLALFFGWPALFHPAYPAPGYGSLGNRIALSPFRIPRKQWGGFRPLAELALLSHCRHVLISSDARGEGMFIAEVALLDPHRPGLVVDRSSKLLASSTWNGTEYQALYSTIPQVAAALGKSGVDAVVIDPSPLMIRPHQQWLERTVTGPGSAYHAAGAAIITREGKAFPVPATLYRAGPRETNP